MEENREKTNIVMSKRKPSNTDDNDVKRWSGLPNDLLESIKKRLFFADHCNLNEVCKSWSSTEGERNRIPPLQQMPWLLVFDKPDSCKLVDSVYKKTYAVDMKSIKEKMNISSLDRIQCHESKYGWLLISSMDQSPDSTRLFLYSPFLGENNNCIELPILNFGICVATFTLNPLDMDDCAVLTLNKPSQCFLHEDAITINTYRRGHSSWNSLVFKCDQFSLCHVKRWMYTDEGIFYYVIGDGRVGTFDLAREEWKVFPPLSATMQRRLELQFYDRPGTDEKVYMVYMVKSGGELFLISQRTSHWCHGLHLIYKLDLSSMIWEELNSIGERVLFIGSGYNSILNSPVLKSDGERTKISDTIYYCSLSQLFYCTVHDYTATTQSFPGWCRCERHYGFICREGFGNMLIDPPPPLHH